MVENLQPIKALDGLEQAVYYHSRERVRSLRDITQGLYRNLQLPLNHGSFTAAQLGALTRPIVVVCRLEITGASPSGVVWEIGSSTQGAGLSVNSGSLVAAAGDGTGNGGVSTTLAGFVQGERFQAAVCISPGIQKVGLYVNGHLEASATAVSAFTGGAYSDSGAGEIDGVNGTVTPRLVVSAGLTDVAIVSPVSFYLGQTPRGFAA